ncbi:Fatty acid 2-hydroxylase 1 [Striga hermonthica]|uniref:Fatty acid 2-hydroxylase 1 n=1 Tax=Striga hermonthica TaxID=68872 RepID=A0A9N7NN70_STRHE|nr:Fatty acid 2-hydroxylase 1 [Striga hermonthica]
MARHGGRHTWPPANTPPPPSSCCSPYLAARGLSNFLQKKSKLEKRKMATAKEIVGFHEEDDKEIFVKDEWYFVELGDGEMKTEEPVLCSSTTRTTNGQWLPEVRYPSLLVVDLQDFQVSARRVLTPCDKPEAMPPGTAPPPTVIARRGHAAAHRRRLLRCARPAWRLIKLFALEAYALTLFGGSILGYVFYDLTHYYLHYRKPLEVKYFICFFLSVEYGRPTTWMSAGSTDQWIGIPAGSKATLNPDWRPPNQVGALALQRLEIVSYLADTKMVVQGFTVDLNKPLVFQVGHLGEEYQDWVHQPIVSKEGPRFFESDFWEFLTRTQWWVIPLIWLPVVSWFIPKSVSLGHTIPQVVLIAALGILVWTLVEYTLHRFLFHIKTKSYWGNTVHYLLHGCHHKHPMDGLRLVFPPAATAVLLYPFWNLIKLISTPTTAPALFGGGLLGYVMYDVTHYYVHHGQPTSEIPKGLKKYHLNHHFRVQNKGYGITSSLWDRVFGTLPPSKLGKKGI